MDSAERWGIFLKYMDAPSMRDTINKILKEDKEVAMAGECMINLSRDEIARINAISEFKAIKDQESRMEDARREGWNKCLAGMKDLVDRGYSFDEAMQTIATQQWETQWKSI